jgi:RimJ/RimL family protein N-acetyltransferase/predicted nucleotidyltransferase
MSAWGADPLIARWTGVPADYSEEAARAWMAGTEVARRAGRLLAFAIVDVASGALVGSCDLRLPVPDDTGLGEIGYLLVPEARGRGLATRAVALLTDWSFRELGMERIQVLAHPGNPGSAGVVERLGFRREGLLRRYRASADGREDRIVFSVLPGELVQPVSANPRGERAAAVDEVLRRLVLWAEGHEDVRALALVGSWASGKPRADSDVDVVLLSEAPSEYVERDDWLSEVGAARLVRTVDRGAITERRIALASGVEVEIGVGSPSWASRDPLDAGTQRVVADGMRILHDPDGLLTALAAACASQPD